MNNIEELKKAALVATPGPWTSQSGYPRMIVSETEKWTHYDDCGNPEFTGPAWVCNVGDAQNNADFISLANPAATLALIAQLEASRVVVALYDEKLAAAEAELSAAQQRIDELEIHLKGVNAANRVLSAALDAASARLSKPVVLPDDGLDDCINMWPDNWRNDFDTGYNFGIWRCEQNIKAAGFTVEE